METMITMPSKEQEYEKDAEFDSSVAAWPELYVAGSRHRGEQ
jgi:hypothetical protein